MKTGKKLKHGSWINEMNVKIYFKKRKKRIVNAKKGAFFKDPFTMVG